MSKQLQRVDEVETLVVGQWYLVPSVFANGWSHRRRWWPVIGPQHEDAKLFNFPWQHYHYDIRFFSQAMIDHFICVNHVFSSPLTGPRVPDVPEELPHARERLSEPVLRSFKCYQTDMGYPHFDKERVQNINRIYQEVQAERTPLGWLCPHRRVLLNYEPIDGVITCPLHGLRIDASSGKCIGPAPMPDKAGAA